MILADRFVDCVFNITHRLCVFVISLIYYFCDSVGNLQRQVTIRTHIQVGIYDQVFQLQT
jgi:hypothetical protein